MVTFWCTFHNDRKISQDPKVMKKFQSIKGAWEGAENVPSSCSVFNQRALYALVMNIFLLPPVLFIEYLKPPVFREGSLVPSFVYLLSWAAAHSPCEIKQGLVLFFITKGPGCWGWGGGCTPTPFRYAIQNRRIILQFYVSRRKIFFNLSTGYNFAFSNKNDLRKTEDKISASLKLPPNFVAL